MGGLDELTPDSEESSAGGKSTHIKFWNPRNAADEIPEGSEHRHEQEFYDAAQRLRDMVGQNINVPIGKFMHALVEAEANDNYEAGQELANQLFTPDE